VQKRNKTNATYGDWAVAVELWPAVIFAAAQHTTAYNAHDAYAESSRILLGSTRLNSFTLYFNIKHSA